MTSVPNPATPEPSDTLLPRVLGSVANRLLASETLLLFSAATGKLVAANPKALFDLGLDLDNPFLPSFAEMVGQEVTAWTQVMQGDEVG